MMTTDQQTQTAAAEQPRAPKPPKADIVAGAPVRGLIPRTIEEAARLAEGFYRSGMAPDSYKVEIDDRDDRGNKVTVIDAQATMARLLIGILKGMEVGFPPIAAISNIYIVNNKPTIYGDGALALVLNHSDYEWHKEEITGQAKTDTWTATCTIKRVGIDEPFMRSFTWSDAKVAGLSGKAGPWTKYPARQLKMRARAWAIRDSFADALNGLGIAEEVADIQQETPKAPEPSVQQDEFTMKALENQPTPTVDFSTMGKRQEAEEVVVSTGVSAEIIPQAADNPAPKAEPCKTCSGRGIVDDADGKGPCPDCTQKAGA